MTGLVYLDANASQRLRPAARAAMLAAFEVAGNPSSVHRAGRSVRRIMEDARDVVAGGFGVRAQDVVFTSGGTEADATAIHALGAGRRTIISAIEHDAVRSAAPGAVVLPVDGDGVADLTALEARLGDGIASLVCVMLANNETGVTQPVREAAVLCRRFGALLHVDAVQAAGRMPVRLDELGADSLAVSSHKVGGPAGVGALLLAPEAPFLGALIGGGGQERGRRGGPGLPRRWRRARATICFGWRGCAMRWSTRRWRAGRWCAAIPNGGCRTRRAWRCRVRRRGCR